MDKWSQRFFEECRAGDRYFIYIDQGTAFRFERVDAARCHPFIRIEDVIPRHADLGITIRRCHALVMDVLSPLLHATTHLCFTFVHATDVPHNREIEEVTRLVADAFVGAASIHMSADASLRMWYCLERCLS